MYPKTTALIATIFLLSFKNLSSMDPQAQPKAVQSISSPSSTSSNQVQRYVPFVPGLAMNQLMGDYMRCRHTTERNEHVDRTYLLMDVSKTLERQRQAKYHAPYKQALKDIEERWHLTNHGTPSNTSIENMRLLAYRDDIQRLPTPSIQPIDHLINIDPSQIARLRQLVRTYSMYDYQLRVDPKNKNLPHLQQEAMSYLDETYGDILDVISELPTNIVPDAYDQETMILNIRQILKRHAQLERFKRYQELQQKLSVAIAATSHAGAAAARDSSVDSVNT